jgi:hypothetical protein
VFVAWYSSSLLHSLGAVDVKVLPVNEELLQVRGCVFGGVMVVFQWLLCC